MNTFKDDRVRRLATILAADIVGYSALMDADEEGTYAALRLARTEVIDPEIEKHNGHIVKHMGDGFLAEFPTVMAAVQFAMAMQEDMGRLVEGIPEDRQIKFRIGINLGDIIVDDDGDIFGDGVNIAARLESLGIPGGICISGPVYETIHKKLDAEFDDIGEQHVKNISRPVHAYDIRWEGEAGTPDERAVKPTSRSRPFGLIAATALAAVAIIGIVFWQKGPTEPGVAGIPPKSVAVLPFINMSSDPEQEYFSDGITEEILDDLAKLPDLKVSARTSAFSFKGTNVPIPEIARILGVANVLEGSVRRAGDRVRITAQLVDADTGFHLWSNTYDRELADIFAVQDEIAAKIAAALEVQLLGDAPTVQATNPEAYTLFLQARYLGRQLTPEALEKSIALFEQALAIDPDYPPAWAGLANTYTSQTNQGLRPYDEGYRLVREAANQALALDPEYALAHESLAKFATEYDLDFVAAARHYERALAIEPANTEIISGGARMFAVLGRMDQAIALGEYVAAHDPVNPYGNFNLGFIYLNSGRLDEAIASYRTTLSLSPGYIGAQYLIGTALLLKGEPELALAAMEMESEDSWRLIGLVPVYHVLGDATASDAALAELTLKYEQNSAYNIAYVLAFQDKANGAFEWLEKAVTYHDPGLVDITTQPLFANIHDDPRWLPFLESIGKSPEQLAAIEFNVTLPE